MNNTDTVICNESIIPSWYGIINSAIGNLLRYTLHIDLAPRIHERSLVYASEIRHAYKKSLSRNRYHNKHIFVFLSALKYRCDNSRTIITNRHVDRIGK